MKKLFHPAASRGNFDFGWLKINHSFSFGHYFNPEKVNVRMLRVLNDDFIEGGEWIGIHPLYIEYR